MRYITREECCLIMLINLYCLRELHIEINIAEPDDHHILEFNGLTDNWKLYASMSATYPYLSFNLIHQDDSLSEWQ